MPSDYITESTDIYRNLALELDCRIHFYGAEWSRFMMQSHHGEYAHYK